MSDGVIVEFSKSPMWDRNIAIHEAGHAMAAWFTGARQIEISIADEFRIARLANGKEVDNCLAVCSHLPVRKDELAQMVVSFSGVMAQHLYSGEPPEKLLENGGKGDASDIRKVLEQYRNQGATGDDCDKLYSRAYLISLKLVKHYWWEIIALAKMVEHYNYVASNKVSSMLSYFVSTQHICCSLEDLERE
ncbi:hypothetical protein ACRWWY_00120 [Escherichia coli]